MRWTAILPELYFSLVAAAFFLFAMMKDAHPRRDYAVAVVLAVVGIGVSLFSVRAEGLLFFDGYRVDLFSQTFKVLIATGFTLAVWLCMEVDVPKGQHPEFYFLLTTCTLGMMCLVSSVELLTLYVSLELTSYSLYVLVPMRRRQRSEVSEQKKTDLPTEAGLKYFLIGATTSAVMLFGLASLFGATGTTHMRELVRLLPQWISTPMGFVGLLFTLSGFFFKLAYFPFHVWGPTVYQAASDQVTTFIATTTKVMAIAVITRIVAMSGGSDSLARLLLIFSIASMSLGNLAALVQKDVKRLLAYSAISHAGYVLIGVLSMTPKGYTAALFYAAAYMAMTFLCFLVVVKVSSEGRNLAVPDLAGLHRRSPLLAMGLMVGVFSLGGIPPTIGFTGKFLVFTAAMEKGHFVLVLIAMANVAVSLYYYIQIIRAAYLLEPDGEGSAISLSLFGKSLTVALVIFVFLGGVFPGYLYEVAARAAGVLP